MNANGKAATSGIAGFSDFREGDRPFRPDLFALIRVH
jgi:hypothetical protein